MLALKYTTTLSLSRCSQPLLPYTPTTTAQPRKCKHQQNSKNIDPDALPKKHRYSPRQSNQEKLTLVFSANSDAHWKLGDFLFYAFQIHDDNLQAVHWDHVHAAHTQHFLHGHTQYTPATIIDLWFCHPNGRDARTKETEPMYSLTIPFTELKYIHPSLTAFAAQTVHRQLVCEADKAVRPKNGLHASWRMKPPLSQTPIETHHNKKKIEWTDIGSATVPRMEEIFRKHQPLTWVYLLALAKHKKKKHRDEEIALGNTRRPSHVVTQVVVHALASLNFARSNRANLLPTAQGFRIGTMPAYSTVYHTLEDLAAHKATVVQALGRDSTKFGTIFLDNMQNYLCQRDARVGRENTLNIGITATYVEASGVDPKAFNLEDKRRQLKENKQEGLTVPMLLSFVDEGHRETTRAAKQCLPVEISKVHPLAASGKNETVTTELKDTMLDFLAQLGQSPDEFRRSVQITGDDGLTYEKLAVLKDYLQFHDDNFKHLSIVEPALALWHTAWTDLSRLVETHWGVPLSKDPSTLGHSAAKISRKTPSSLKKVEYNSRTEMTYLILDIRMLDCWRIYFKLKQSNLFDYFKGLASTNDLPEFEDLEVAARKLYHRSARQPIDPPVTSESHAAVGTVGKGPLTKTKQDGEQKDTSQYSIRGIKVQAVELRHAILNSLLVNLSGRPGHFMAGDLMQEHFNRLLQVIAKCKGTKYGAHFVHDVVSHNLHHMAHLQNDLKEGVGLSQRSGHHHDPYACTEVAILSQEYQEQELHSRRPGQEFALEKTATDDYCGGLAHLCAGKLQHWINDTIRLHGDELTTPNIIMPNDKLSPLASNSPPLDADIDVPDDDSTEAMHLPSVHMIDGRLVINPVDLDADIDKILAELDESGHAVMESDGEDKDVHDSEGEYVKDAVSSDNDMEMDVDVL
ncbi:hypothetical protein B0H21DRAFT_712469 [Amylocystis lapponica]|nr:hypothetical protein B0H21DRAFT_712469 [Amylocystis lapponica]